MTTLLEEAFDVFPDEVGFEIDGTVDLFEAQHRHWEHALSGNILLNMSLNFFPDCPLGHTQVKLPLKSDPEIRRRS